MNLRVLLPVAVAVVSLGVSSWACPFCSAPEMTLAEQFFQADLALLGKWKGGEPAKGEKPGTTEYEIVEVSRDPLKTLKAGDMLTLPRHRAGKPGDLCLLLGTKGTTVEWVPLDVTEEGYKYIAQSPPIQKPAAERLKYYVKHLESKDPMVAADAYGEFGMANYKDLLAIRDQLPHDTLRKWVESPDTPSIRLGLYGLMLGVCGNADDAAMMEKKIVVSTQDYRLGIDGVMGGYLLLTGDKGLQVIEKTKFEDEKVPFSELFAALQAVRFMRGYGTDVIPEERLKASLRLLLDRVDIADIIIADLARWKDWSVQDRLMEMFESEKYSVPSIRRAIVRYMHACTKDMPKEATQKPDHVAAAEKHLAELRERDPKLVKDVERFLQ